MKYQKTIDISKLTHVELKRLQRGQWVRSGKTMGVFINQKDTGESVIMWHGRPSVVETILTKLIGGY